MKTRIISGLLMVPLLIIIYFGKIPLLLASMVIAIIGIKEFFTMYEKNGIFPSKIIAYLLTALLYGYHLIAGFNFYFLVFWIVISIAISLLYGLNISYRGPYDAIITLTGLMYIVLFTYHIVMLDGTIYRNLVWMIVISAFGSDIFAYFVGSFFGKHKMAPNLSPKKSIEGAIGGVMGAGLLGMIFGLIFMNEIWYHCLIIGITGGIVSEFGDLVASSFKRYMGIKDYGNLIPGHGGIMDRFDSVIFVAPAIYYYVLFVLIQINNY